MDFSKINLFKALTRKMAWLGERQEVLAQNVANANTPGFKAKDIKPADFRDILGQTVAGAGGAPAAQAGRPLVLAVTDPGHVTGTRSGPQTAAVFETHDRDAPGRLSGNDVVLERELAKVGQTAMDYELTTNLYRRHVAMFRLALGRNGS
ncbi:MAG TPA: flagellar basal body protein [Alphaproteobacteria bacterium]|jgi:flagellar basal-body rod protein FlgB